VPGKVKSSEVTKLDNATTVNGQRVAIEVKSGKVMIDNATVIATDVMASNGVIHVIDRVILPESKNIVEVADSAGSFATLLAAAQAAGLADVLANDGPFTVFAPTDAAFAKLPAGTVETLLKPENRGKLADVLKYHVVQGRVYSDAALKAGNAKTLLGGQIKIKAWGGKAMVNNAELLETDIEASNGVIHVIDTVLLPE